jgi:hypothetical protein
MEYMKDWLNMIVETFSEEIRKHFFPQPLEAIIQCVCVYMHNINVLNVRSHLYTFDTVGYINTCLNRCI